MSHDSGGLSTDINWSPTCHGGCQPLAFLTQDNEIKFFGRPSRESQKLHQVRTRPLTLGPHLLVTTCHSPGNHDWNVVALRGSSPPRYQIVNHLENKPVGSPTKTHTNHLKHTFFGGDVFSIFFQPLNKGTTTIRLLPWFFVKNFWVLRDCFEFLPRNKFLQRMFSLIVILDPIGFAQWNDVVHLLGGSSHFVSG